MKISVTTGRIFQKFGTQDKGSKQNCAETSIEYDTQSKIISSCWHSPTQPNIKFGIVKVMGWPTPHLNIGFKYSFELVLPFEFVKLIKIRSRNSSTKDLARLPINISFQSKQARISILFFKPSKNQAIMKLLLKARSRSRREFWH